jgi:hypothetical protein
VGEIEVQTPEDLLWQRRDEDLVVLLALERLAHGLVRVGGPDDPLHMRARGWVERRALELKRDGRLLSSGSRYDGENCLWMLTEADRSVTTIPLPGN